MINTLNEIAKFVKDFADQKEEYENIKSYDLDAGKAKLYYRLLQNELNHMMIYSNGQLQASVEWTNRHIYNIDDYRDFMEAYSEL